MTAPPATTSADRKLPHLALAATLLLIVAPLVAFGVLRRNQLLAAREVNLREAREWLAEAKPVLDEIALKYEVEYAISVSPEGGLLIDEAELSGQANEEEASKRFSQLLPFRGAGVARWTDWGPHKYLVPGSGPHRANNAGTSTPAQ